jgi:hypothetical protein
LQLYGFNNFKKNYNFGENLEKEVKSEKYFQMQFSYDTNIVSADKLINEYNFIIDIIRKNKVSIVNQFKNNI